MEDGTEVEETEDASRGGGNGIGMDEDWKQEEERTVASEVHNEGTGRRPARRKH